MDRDEFPEVDVIEGGDEDWDPFDSLDDGPFEDPEPPGPAIEDHIDGQATDEFKAAAFDPELDLAYTYALLRINTPDEYERKIRDLWPNRGVDPVVVRAFENLVSSKVQRRHEVEGRVIQLVDPPGGSSNTPLEFTRASGLRNRPRTGWLIDRILMEHSLAVLFGAPNGGKSFLALDWAMSIAHGLQWQGRDCAVGSVAFVAAEGSAELEPRISAWQREHECDENDILRENLYILGEAPNLSQSTTAASLAIETTRIDRLKLIVIDTLARTMVDGDENSAKDVGRFIRNIELIRRATGAAVLLIHHTSKQGDVRGSTALRGAATTMLCLKAPKNANGGLILECEKQKEEKAFTPLSLSLGVIDLGDGVTSCVIRDWDPVPAMLNPNNQAACGVLVEQFGGNGASYTDWCAATKAANGMSDSSFRRAVTALKDEGYVQKATGKTGAYTPTAKARDLLAGGVVVDLSTPQPRTDAD